MDDVIGDCGVLALGGTRVQLTALVSDYTSKDAAEQVQRTPLVCASVVAGGLTTKVDFLQLLTY